ncbi:hypothetical protein CEP53_011235 [Fusarium sp. AF-6]|nr:hypothetical protein CEP53_011235 [Fusarium sp. AF-6]
MEPGANEWKLGRLNQTSPTKAGAPRLGPTAACWPCWALLPPNLTKPEPAGLTSKKDLVAIQPYVTRPFAGSSSL